MMEDYMQYDDLEPSHIDLLRQRQEYNDPDEQYYRAYEQQQQVPNTQSIEDEEVELPSWLLSTGQAQQANNDFDDVPSLDGVLTSPVKKKKETSWLDDIKKFGKDAYEGTIGPMVQQAVGPWFDESHPQHQDAMELLDTGNKLVLGAGEALTHEIPQGSIDLGIDILNVLANGAGNKDDLIDRKAHQYFPTNFPKAGDSRYDNAHPNLKAYYDEVNDSGAFNLARVMGQFVTIYGVAKKLIGKGIKGTVKKELAAGAVAAGNLDPTEGNISTMLLELNLADNAVVEFLDSKVEDEAKSEARLVARLKNMVEDAPFTLAIPAIIATFRQIKRTPEHAEALKEWLQGADIDPAESINKLFNKLGFPEPIIQKEMVMFHGSGAKYTNIDPTKQTTGVLGKGHYVSTSEKEAMYYRPSAEFDIDAKFNQAMKDNDGLAQEIWDMALGGETPITIRKTILKNLEGNELARAKKIIDEYETMLPGYMYRVGVQDDIVEKSIYYGKSFKAQPKFVQNVLRKLGIDENAERINIIAVDDPSHAPFESTGIQSDVLKSHGIKAIMSDEGRGGVKNFNIIDVKDAKLLSRNREGFGGVAQQSSESLPSTGLASGKHIQQLPIEKQTQHQEAINKITDDFIEQILGLKRISSTTAPSRYEGHVGSSQQIIYKIETMVDDLGNIVPTKEARQQLRKSAAIKGYIQDQDAVVNSFLSPITDISKADVASINIGRVLTNKEMNKVDSLIEQFAKDNNIESWKIATPTTKDGINLLNVGDIDNAKFIELNGIIKTNLNAKSVSFYRNTLLDEGYVGGFDGYESGQKEYAKIAKLGKTGNSGRGNSTQQWWGNADSIEQKRQQIRSFTEDFIQKNPLEPKPKSKGLSKSKPQSTAQKTKRSNARSNRASKKKEGK